MSGGHIIAAGGLRYRHRPEAPCGNDDYRGKRAEWQAQHLKSAVRSQWYCAVPLATIPGLPPGIPEIQFLSNQADTVLTEGDVIVIRRAQGFFVQPPRSKGNDLRPRLKSVAYLLRRLRERDFQAHAHHDGTAWVITARRPDSPVARNLEAPHG